MTIEELLSLPIVVFLRWLLFLLAMLAYLFIVTGNWRLMLEERQKKRANDTTPTPSPLSGSTGFLLLAVYLCPLKAYPLVSRIDPAFFITLLLILVFLDPLALWWVKWPFLLLWKIGKWLRRKISVPKS